MNRQQQIQQYRSIQVESSTPEALVVLAYDGLLKFLNVAKIRIAEKNLEASHEALKKAQLIILELVSALNVDAWEGATDLLRLYEFMLERLKQANMKKIVEPIDEVLPIAQNLRDAWQEAYRMVQARKKNGATGTG